MVKYSEIDTMRLDGGLLCLDFINSVHGRHEQPLRDYFSGIHDLIHWAKRLGVIDSKTEKKLTAASESQPAKSLQFFNDAIAFRELMFVIFRNIISEKKVPAAQLKKYNDMLKIYFPYLQIKQSGQGFEEQWLLDETDFKRLLAPILNDSYETLLSDKLRRIKECSNCGWLFYDTTKNGKRRWCSMQTCGSNVKALDWYYRQKK
jgi:predicted RNA-binding Zn ribbon-like protein